MPAGNHSFTANFSGGGTFEASTASTNVVVTPATLTLTADNQVIVFGSPLPAFTFTSIGFVNGDGAAVISGTPQFSTSATSSSSVGTYPITIGPGTLAAANYSFAFVNGALTISQATPSLILSCPTGIIHNGHRHSCPATVTGVGGAPVSGSLVITYNGSLRPPNKVGTYTVQAVFTSADANYSNATATASLVIQPNPEDGDENDDSQ
ncbi:MAG TPA: MBG domain-containing protein [Candidatus Angelobacter sp.]|nr:MBG domain-containing protein [Candidatus Angelobacter sp.]